MKFFKYLFESIFNKGKNSKVFFVNYFFQHILGINKKFPLMVHYTTQINNPDRIKTAGGKKLVQSFALSGNCYFSAYNWIHLGYNVLFAPGIKIISSNHDFSKEREPVSGSPVIIKDNVWIGTNVVILPEVVIGENAIIAAGALVKNNVPANCIVAGIPAKVIGWICECGNKLSKNEKDAYTCEKCQSEYYIVNSTLTKK